MEQPRVAGQLTIPGLASLRAAALSQSPVSQGSRRTNSPHEFYRYPGRFTPEFARAAIETFSSPGGIVLDPFVGGGTTLVEAMRVGRRGIGADLNELATFVSTVKTTVLTEVDFVLLRRWVNDLPKALDLRGPSPSLHEWRIGGYLKDLDAADTWRLRSLIARALVFVDALPREVSRNFARCIILRTAQWALDMRHELPSVEGFRGAMMTHAEAMLETARRFADDLADDFIEPIVLTEASPGLADRDEIAGIQPDLVLTSPPYPGVYVLYHRWKLRGRSEIAAPFWIANRNDGLGIASYTMSARSDKKLDLYFRRLTAAFQDLRRLTPKSSHIVQVVGFNNVAQQFDRYLHAMTSAGFEELRYPELATAGDGRLWRLVPGRRWWTTTTSLQEVAPHTSREVVLIHRPVAVIPR
jgi:hypothetical protein